MSSFSAVFKDLRLKKGWSQQRLADELRISKSSVNMYERGEREPGFETLEHIADIFNVDMDYLMGRSLVERKNPVVLDGIPPGFIPLPETYKVPLVDRIACGQPITAEENIEDYMDVPKGKHVDFCLICEGDSMIDAGISDGDVVYIRKQPDVENGQIAAVRIGNEATLKRVYKYPDKLILQPANTAYPPLSYTGAELEDVQIEGKAVGWLHWA